jgi:hypothetical protein
MSSIEPQQLFDKVQTLLAKAEMPERHTFFQMKNFIVGKECTVQGQLWQITRELRARQDSILALHEQLEDAGDNVALLDIAVERLRSPEPKEDELGARERQIRIRKVERERASLERTLQTLKNKSKYLLEEMAYLFTAHETLSKISPMKPLDDVDAQKEYWNEKLTEELNLRLLLRHPLDCDFVKTILALEDTSPVKKQMVEILGKVQTNMIAERDRQLSLKADCQTGQHKALLKKQGGK